jgi:UDP-N-acetylglucosamine--N-acetylmuramyl-(pentapeptide) pyrophosphoryl-undecaprenol N-acetylglucosamine transferase
MKILIAGGHLTPALALIEEIQTHHHDEIVFVGHKVIDKKTHINRERQVIENLGIKFEEVPVVKWDRNAIQSVFLLIPRLLQAGLVARNLINKHQPDVIIGFGGYFTISLAIGAAVTGTKLIIHEQTTRAGLANRLASKVARKVAISYQSSRSFFPQNKIVFTGNILRRVFFESIQQPNSLSVVTTPFIFITGGSQGSNVLNNICQELVWKISDKYQIVHQYGNGMPLQAKKKSKQNYLGKDWFTDREIAFLLQHARIVVCRSGANTVSEVMASQSPAILVPLPNTQQDEQVMNAHLISDAGAGIIILQESLTLDNLVEAITTIDINHAKFSSKAKDNLKYIRSQAVADLYGLLKG